MPLRAECADWTPPSDAGRVAFSAHVNEIAPADSRSRAKRVAGPEGRRARPKMTPVTEASPADDKSSFEAAFVRLLTKPRLAVGLMLAAVCLAAPSLFIG